MLTDEDVVMLRRLHKKKEEPWTIEQLALYFGVNKDLIRAFLGKKKNANMQ
jgi:DNA-directed RNA polymerase sigma subunit (sigma70/sigma32)